MLRVQYLCKNHLKNYRRSIYSQYHCFFHTASWSMIKRGYLVPIGCNAAFGKRDKSRVPKFKIHFHVAGYSVIETMKTPASVIHHEDTQTVSTKTVSNMMTSCGKLGRYRGSAKTRLRGRMREMVRIIGGRPAPPGKWPWQVAVLNRYKVTVIYHWSITNLSISKGS